MKRYDHIDLRVSNLAAATRFYETLLPALGFTRRVEIEGWLQFESEEEGMAPFFGVTESTDHMANENRIAFGAESREEIERLAAIVADAGGTAIEGPMEYTPGYHAVFFEDPCGNRFEICHRT